MTFEEKDKAIFIHSYISAAVEMIEGTLVPLKKQLAVLDDLITAKAAPTAATVEAAKGNTPSEGYTNFRKLSTAWPFGSLVDSPDGERLICGYVDDQLVLRLDNGKFGLYKPTVCHLVCCMDPECGFRIEKIER